MPSAAGSKGGMRDNEPFKQRLRSLRKKSNDERKKSDKRPDSDKNVEKK